MSTSNAMLTEAHFRELDLIEEETFSPCEKCAHSAAAAQRCRLIRARVQDFDGNIAATARDLGISRTTIYAHIRS